MSPTGWIGKPVKRVEDARLLTGRGTYIDDHPPVANLHHAAIVRSPHAHARIVGYDLTAALAVDGVVGAVTGEDVLRHTKPFSVGVTAPVHYYCAATDKARFVGEPVAVLVAKTRYIAEDAAELVRVRYEPLPAVVDPERALEPDAPVLHDAVGTNLAGHRRLVYGDPDRAFGEADVVLKERFRFPKYGSTPIETYGVIAAWDSLEGVCTVWSNFMGPFIMHPLTARVLGLPENKLRFIVPPDIGGSFGIKTSIYPYIALIALAARRTGVPVKWIEDRREHLLASSSGTDRVAYRELAAKKDGTILGMRFRWLDNVGGYIRSPEPGCSFRPTGNFVGPYRFQNLEVDASVVMTNKSLTGPNRGSAPSPSTCRSRAPSTRRRSRSIRSGVSLRFSARHPRARAIRRSSRRSSPTSSGSPPRRSRSWTRWTRSRASGPSRRAPTRAASAPSERARSPSPRASSRPSSSSTARTCSAFPRSSWSSEMGPSALRQGRDPRTRSRTSPGAPTGTPSRFPRGWSRASRRPRSSASRSRRPWTRRTA